MLDARAPLPPAIQSYLKQRNALGALLDSPQSAGLTLARKHADVADGMLQELFASALRRNPPGCGPDVLLAAVGGYGRQQLGWKSDLDVMFVTTADAAELERFVEAVLYPLWDAGVAIGHQVMRVEDFIDNAREALPTATALLDFRPLAGSAHIGEQLRDRAFVELFSPIERAQFVERLAREVEERWRRYGDSVYLLEPDVKNGAGGLRDVDVACWTARASFRGNDWSELARSDVLTAREVDALQDAANFFFCVRNYLHHAAARRNDRLTFDQQETVALRMGYRSSMPPVAAAEQDWIGPTVEAFMSDYYVHARAVTRAQEQVLERAISRARSSSLRGTQSRVKLLEPGIILYDDQLGFTCDEDLQHKPALALRLYVLAVEQNRRVLPAARDVISRLAGEDAQFCAALRKSPEAARAFVQLLGTVSSNLPFRNGSVLAELHAVGLLLALIPEFAPVVGRVHHDLYHVYTVDVHSVSCVDRVRALMRGELMQRHAIACRLAAEAYRPERVLFAALLHDIGKVFGGKEHSMRGAAMARSILARFGLAADDIDHISKLVLHHLTMYFTAARRDLADMGTIEQFADVVADRDCLRSLYLLTIADISTTAPTSMTSWKARMLDELYALTDERLGAGNCDPLRRARAELYEHTDGSLERKLVDELLGSMPERYLLSHSAQEIAAHARIVQAARGKRLHLQLAPSRHTSIAELCVITGAATDEGGVGDRPGLLASIAAALTACKLEIFAAQIYTRDRATPQEQVLDVFWVRDRVHGVEELEELLPKLERTLLELISGAVTPQELLQKRASTRWSERPSPAVPVEIGVDNRSSKKYTIVEVIAQDRPGLLYTLAHTLHELGLSIELAKVNTEGNRVVDIFYVTELDESKLASRTRIDELKAALFAALGRSASN